MMKRNGFAGAMTASALLATLSVPASADFGYSYYGHYYGKQGKHQHIDGTPFEGAVYAMSNDVYANTLVAYGRKDDGTLEFIGDFKTGGKGAAFDGGEGLDPLISAYSVLLTDDREHVIAVNAGSNSISVFRINDDFSLTLTDKRKVYGVGPNSVAYHNGLLYVSSIDSDGEFAGEPDQEGNLTGFRLNERGRLKPLKNSVRLLGNRPSAVQFSPDGHFLLALQQYVKLNH